MEDAALHTEANSYLKGKARNWFWPAAGMLAGLFVLVSLSNPFYVLVFGQREVPGAGLILALAVMFALLHAAVWITIPLAYGRNNTVRTFRFFFIALALLEIPYTVTYFLSWRGVSYVFPQLFTGSTVAQINDAAVYVICLFWVLFMMAVICDKMTGRALRLAAIAVLVTNLLFLLYCYYFDTMVQNILLQYDEWTSTMYIHLLNTMMHALDMGTVIVFLWAMAFTRRRAEKEFIAGNAA